MIYMQYLEYALVAMFALSPVNCPILKIINYCELYNTQDSRVHSNTVPYAELQFLGACAISKLCFTLIYNVLSPPMLCGCDLHIATPHCVDSVLNITNHNRLDNFQSQEIVKASSEIVQ